MKILYLLLSTALVILSCNTTHTDINLQKAWRISSGDDLNWAKAEYDDSNWDSISAGILWENGVLKGYDGIAWYRKTFFLSENMKKALSPGQKSLILKLGKIDDVDEIYLNGVKISSTGNFMQKDEYSYSKMRVILVPVDQLHWNENNILAVRVNDFGGGGGMYEGPYGLFISDWTDYVKVSYDVPDDDQHLFRIGDNIRVFIKCTNASAENYSMKIKMAIRDDQHKPFEWQSKKLKLEANNSDSSLFVISVSSPGFYEAAFECRVKGKHRILRGIEYFGCEPENIAAGTSKPEDFNEYWKNARLELSNIKPRYKMTRVPEFDTDFFEVYDVEMHSWGNARVHGWYSKPKNPGLYPALVSQSGYSSNQQPNTSIEGFAMLAFNIRGHGKSIEDVNPGFPQYITMNILDKENYIYKGAYMDCIRAVDFLCSRPEVDTTRIGVFGGSQGGALSFASAALDHRIKACAPDIPFLSNFREYFKICNFPRGEFDKYLLENPDVKWEDIYKTLDYIDIRNLTPWITCPVLMGVGLRDQVCPPFTNFSAFNNLSSVNTEFYVFPEFAHAVPAEHYTYKQEWFRKQLSMKE